VELEIEVPVSEPGELFHSAPIRYPNPGGRTTLRRDRGFVLGGIRADYSLSVDFRKKRKIKRNRSCTLCV
jgi:hypothetical protein